MISDIVLSSLMNNKSFARKVLPHIESEYFEDVEHKTLFEYIKKYVVKYKNLPTNNTLKLEITKDETLPGALFENIVDVLDSVYQENNEYDNEWLIENCEQWCKDRALHNAIVKSVELIEKNENKSEIPDLVRKALQVEFETTIGIEFFDDKGIKERHKIYNKKDIKYSTGVPSLDNVFAGGLEHKALTVLMSGTGMGKTSSMCGLTANFLRNGHNVLYITLEMAEEKIAQRIDANFLGVDINDVPLIKEKSFTSKLNQIKDKTKGRLVIKEYPPANISVQKLRFLLDELKIKLGFEPDILVVDYINLMVSDRIKSDNMYSVVKSITEELRGLMVEKTLCGLSATQGNRQTNDESNSDIDLTNVSESTGLSSTVDALVGIIMPGDLREQNLQIWKILKNRFGGVVNHKIPIKVNFSRAALYDNDQEEVIMAGNSMSNSIQMKTEENRIREKNKIVVQDVDSIDIESEIDDMIS